MWRQEKIDAYRSAHETPRKRFRFQDEDGFKSVHFIPGSPPAIILGELVTEGTLGYWYEVSLRDDTKIADANERIGQRIYDNDGMIKSLISLE